MKHNEQKKNKKKQCKIMSKWMKFYEFKEYNFVFKKRKQKKIAWKLTKEYDNKMTKYI